MPRLFISHSSTNNAEAIALRDWLQSEGWDDVFLDLDPSRGIATGERWERALNEAAKRCEAVIFLLSRAWLASKWCERELNLAHRLNKRLFGVLIEDMPVADIPAHLAGAWQSVRLDSGQDHTLFRVTIPITGDEAHVTFSAEGLARLRSGLNRAGLDPRFFAWPPEDDPKRPPYRGLLPLEAEDAGIFFGRESEVIDALDRLRGLNMTPPPRLLVILGASGAGKSSFLRAGLWPRLKRDDRSFQPLPVIRPQQGAITGDTGLVRCLEDAFRAQGAPQARASIRAAVEQGLDGLLPLLAELQCLATPPALGDKPEAPPTLVFSIDQGEELFRSEGATEAQAFLALLRDTLTQAAPSCMGVITIRSDSYEQLQTATVFETVPQHTFSLPHMAKGAYSEIIEGPARRLVDGSHALKIEPALTAALLADVESGGGKDALPLLAFTLERLHVEHGGDGALTLADYSALGRVKGSIEEAVERTLKAAAADPALPRERQALLALLRRGLIPWLAGIDPDTGSPRRRVARASEIPEEARPLIGHLVDAHLLATDIDRETGETTIEPSHEALLRQWGVLKGWLEEELGALTTLEGVKRAASEWEVNAKGEAWLAHRGGRLEEAERVAAREDLARILTAGERGYLASCRIAENVEAEREHQRQAAESAARELATTARRRMVGLMVAVLLVLVTAGAAFWAWQQQQFTEKLRRETQITESGLLANVANAEFDFGRNGNTLLLALEALPDPVVNVARPYVAEAELQLDRANRELTERLVFGHGGPVHTASFSPDGSRIVTATNNGTVRVWDAATGKELARLDHDGQIAAAAFSPDGLRIITATSNGTVRVWDVATGGELARLDHDGQITAAAFSPDGLRIVIAFDKTALVWDAATGKELARLIHKDTVRSAVFNLDGTHIITASGDMTGLHFDFQQIKQEVLRLEDQEIAASRDSCKVASHSKIEVRAWDVPTGKELTRFSLKGGASSSAFSSDKQRIVTEGEDNTVRVWDTATGKELSHFIQDKNSFESVLVRFSPDGKRIVIASDGHQYSVGDAGDNSEESPYRARVGGGLVSRLRRVMSLFANARGATVLVGDVTTGRELARLKENGRISAVAFNPDGTRIVTASDDKTARVWDAATGKELARVEHDGSVRTAAFSPDGSRIVTASNDKTARVWDVATGKAPAWFQHDATVWAVAFSPDGTRIVTTSSDKTARVWDAATGKELARLGHGDKVLTAAFNPDGARIVTGSEDKNARVWDAATGEELARLRHNDMVWAAAFSPDGARIVTASGDKTARVWDAATGKVLARFGHYDKVFAASFSTDGTRIVTASEDKNARVWDAATGIEFARLGHDDKVFAASFCPDDARIVTASEDKTARVWDTVTGEELAKLRHDDMVWAAAFSPDGARIVTASSDKTARVWDTATGKELARLNHEGEVTAAAFSLDTSAGYYRIVTASGHSAYIWRVEHSTDNLVQIAKHRVPRCLTQAQRKHYFLPAAPPIWCITGAGLEAKKDPTRWRPKWPYQSPAWRDWLVARQRGEYLPMPRE